MTGRYLIYTPLRCARDERAFDKAWHRFTELCRSLHADGLAYEVQLNLTNLRPHVLVTASGKAHRRKPASVRRMLLPPPVPAQRCRERAQEAAWFLPENAQRRNSHTTYWRKHQARFEELSAMAEEYLRAELEYWQELEALSGQRQHYKPGLTAENAYQDDEVAA
jgi:hypothetical protein